MLAAGASSTRDLPAAQLPHRVRAAYRRLPDWCPEFLWWQRLRGVWRPVLATLFLGLLFAAPLIWSREHQHLGSRRAGYRFVARFLHNAHGRPIYADATEDAAVPKWQLKARVRAAIVVLARDADCEGVLRGMARMEQRFNAKFGYPYVFLNNDPFGAEFVNRTSAATTARTLYGVVPPEHWGYPSFVDPKAAAKARMDMLRHRVLYGDRESYHHMCRYYSGFFHLHPLLQEFDYYWRMEPDVHYYCDLDYDPFLYMQENRIKYGFVITIEELPATIPSLWATTQAFMAARSDLLPAANLLSFVRAQSGDYNLCHFWSNFELGDLNFFRSEAYKSYFDYLDRTGGFFFERWGDAPVHSLAAAMFLNSTEVHFFQDIGYRHNSYKHCPAEQRNNCHCDALEAVAFHTPSFGVCHRRWTGCSQCKPIDEKKGTMWRVATGVCILHVQIRCAWPVWEKSSVVQTVHTGLSCMPHSERLPDVDLQITEKSPQGCIAFNLGGGRRVNLALCHKSRNLVAVQEGVADPS